MLFGGTHSPSPVWLSLQTARMQSFTAFLNSPETITLPKGGGGLCFSSDHPNQSFPPQVFHRILNSLKAIPKAIPRGYRQGHRAEALA